MSSILNQLYPDDTKRPGHQRFIQALVRVFFRILFMVMFRLRCHGVTNFPGRGGLMVCSNHQSNLDPILLGVVGKRFNNFLGKQSLFNFKPLAWFLKKNDTIPIDRSSGFGGMKQTLKCLKRAEPVVMFPEGTRTSNGDMKPLKPGFVTLVRRTKASVLPIGIAGAFEAWPKGQMLPWPTTIEMVVGPPITYEESKELSESELVELLSNRIQSCFEEAKQRRQTRIENSVFSFR